MMDLVSEAIVFAVNAHDGMRRRKSEAPYILHPIEVGAIIGTMTDKQEVIAAGVLHDVVEDAGVTIEEIGEKFGARVRELVASETENKRDELPPEETWRIRKEESIEKLRSTDDIEVLMLWIGDKLSNIRAIYRDFLVEGNQLWDKFHQSDINIQAWYYRSIMKYTERLSDTLAWIEYKTLVEKIFGMEE
ncbi:MAG: HD domain-containing protein [Clostridia bacterium]|nr:HD domain-containing protein [Clostridia bacterium]